MTTGIKKLIENLDQLVCWLQDNPNTPMPSSEKKRAETILNKLLSAEELSEQEWANLKPRVFAIRPANTCKGKPAKRIITSAIKTVTKTVEPAIQNTSQRISEKKSKIKYFEKAGKQWMLCPHCSASLLADNFQKHEQNKCSVLKQEKIIRAADKTRGKISLELVVKKSVYDNAETRRDGSYGYHQFRENGRFGSHPSYDNMNDDAHP